MVNNYISILYSICTCTYIIAHMDIYTIGYIYRNQIPLYPQPNPAQPSQAHPIAQPAQPSPTQPA